MGFVRRIGWSYWKVCVLLVIIFTFMPLVGHLPKVNSSKGVIDAQQFYQDTYCDAHLVSEAPDAEYGMEEVLVIHHNDTLSGTTETVVFVKMELTGLSEGDIVQYASIDLKPKDVVGGDEGLLIGAFWCSDSSWDEETITWNNAPWGAISNTPLDLDRGGHTLDEHYFDITPAVQQAIPSGALTIVMKALENGTQYFWSHHGLPGPGMQSHLYVTYISETAINIINPSIEYASGFLPELSLWYTWVNTGATQLIYVVAVYPEYDYYFPSVNFVGQHYYTEDENELVVGHAVLLYELFNDTNQNGILDANFELQVAETKYYLALNISSGFIPQPVQKILRNGVTHYVWSVQYTDVVGYLIYPNGSVPLWGDTAAFVDLAYLETGFDYSLQGNRAFLKTSLDLGEVTRFEALDPDASLEGLSIAALHSTLLLASSPFPTFLVESAEYNSSLSNQPTVPMTIANITVASNDYYNLIFDDNYTLYSEPPSSLFAPTSACPSVSLHTHVPKKQFRIPMHVIQGFLSVFLPRICSTPIVVDLDYQHSGLLYRVNYPQWDGYALGHDPTYVAYFSGEPVFTPPLHWIFIVAGATIGGVVVFVVVVITLRKSRMTEERHQD